MKVKALVAQLCLTLCYPMDCCLPSSSVHGILQARVLEWVVISFPGDLPNPGIEARSPALQADSLPAKPQGKPKNAGVGSLALLQWIFPTQESNWSPLHCRRILYQLMGGTASPSEACGTRAEEGEPPEDRQGRALLSSPGGGTVLGSGGWGASDPPMFLTHPLLG